MKRPGVWFFRAVWAAFAFTWLSRAVAGPNAGRAGDLTMTGVMALFFTALFVGIAAWTPRMPPEVLTRRHPEYWHLPEHRLELIARVADVFYGLAAAAVLLPVLLNVAAVFGYPGWCGFLAVSTFVAATLAVCIHAAIQLDSIGTQPGADGGAARQLSSTGMPVPGEPTLGAGTPRMNTRDVRDVYSSAVRMPLKSAVDRAVPFLEPGEHIQAVFEARPAWDLLFAFLVNLVAWLVVFSRITAFLFTGRYVGGVVRLHTRRIRLVAVTDRAILVIRPGEKPTDPPTEKNPRRYPRNTYFHPKLSKNPAALGFRKWFRLGNKKFYVGARYDYWDQLEAADAALDDMTSKQRPRPAHTLPAGSGPPPIEHMHGQPSSGAIPPSWHGYSPPSQPGSAPGAEYSAPSYPPLGYPAGGYPGVQQPTNRLAIWSLVLSLIGIPLGLIVVGDLALIAGVVTGIIALRHIPWKHQRGGGLAVAAIIIGVIALIIAIPWDIGFFEAMHGR